MRGRPGRRSAEERTEAVLELLSGKASVDQIARRFGVRASTVEGWRDQALPLRDTGPIYFLQLMVRYAMIWGQIPPGEDHEMGHFLEQDMPGAIVRRKYYDSILVDTAFTQFGQHIANRRV